MRRARPARARLGLTTIAFALCLLAACSGGAKHRAGSPGTTPTSRAASSTARSTTPLAIGSVDIQRAGTTGIADTSTRNAVLAIAQRYVDSAILAPLETGRIGAGFATLFVPGLRPAVTGADKGVLADAGVGRTTTLREHATPVALSGLADQSGTLLYLATKFEVTVNATRARGAVAIDRNVELTFERAGSSWEIVAYRVDVTRTTPAPARRRRGRTTTTRTSRVRSAQ